MLTEEEIKELQEKAAYADLVKQKQKESVQRYYKTHREKIREYQREYKRKQRGNVFDPQERLRLDPENMVLCDCGKCVKKSYLRFHLKTESHLSWARSSTAVS